MLTLQQVSQQRRPRRAPPALKQQYEEYRQQRIEGFKNSIAPEELYTLGGEAAVELQTGGAGQFVLTEILMLETVDRMIERRIRLPSYAKWRKHLLPRREAQRQPVHWNIDPGSALASLLPRIESMDKVLVIGAGAQGEACLLAAHEAEVTFVDEDLGVANRLEARMAEESLGGQFMSFVAVLGEWLPPFAPRELHLVVLDATTLAALSHAKRSALLLEVRNLTRPTGVNVIVPGPGAAPEAYVSHYPDWDREALPGSRRGRASRSRGEILTRPNQ